MDKTLVSMIPPAVGLVIAGAVISWLLRSNNGLGPWLLAGFLVAHGLIHLLFFAPAPASSGSSPSWPFDFGQSWLVNAGLDVAIVRIAGAVLVVAIAGVFLLTGLATVNLVVPADWWKALVVISAVVSILTLALFFDPQLLLGLGIDGVLLYVIVSAAWVPAAAVA
jgi:hypothetical protein